MSSEQTKDIAINFETNMKGKMPDDDIHQVTKELLKENTPKYAAHGNLVSFIFYLKVSVSFNHEPYDFSGHAGGASTPGAGALIGSIFTDDIKKLTENTKSFELNAAPGYTSVLFFDSSSKLLGHFQGGAVSIITGIAGGSGHWSKRS